MTGTGNNTYLIVSNGEAALIDAGVGHPDHLAALDRALSDSHSSLRTVLVTHGHSDHAAGVPAIANAYPDATFAKYSWPGDQSPPGRKWAGLADGDEIRVGATALTVVHTPGHSPDHVAFWHEEPRWLFTGDLIIAGGSVMIDTSRGGSLTQYLQSLERVVALGPNRLLPAHGAIVNAADAVNPTALLRSYVEHRLERERQILIAIEKGLRSVEEIAESIYDGLDRRLMPAARQNVRAHLEKLAADGIAADRNGWALL